MTNYKTRIKIKHDGVKKYNFYTKSGEQVAIGYNRIVFGGRGPYMEFTREQMINSAIHIPKSKKWKMEAKHKDTVFYFELRTNKDDVKVYYQRRCVDYADYKVNYFYISSFDLYDSHENVLIEPLQPKTILNPKPKRDRITKAQRDGCYDTIHEALTERFAKQDKINKDMVKFYSGKKSILGHKLKEKDKVLSVCVIHTDNIMCEDSYVSVSFKSVLLSEIDSISKKYYLVTNDRDDVVIVEFEYMFMEISKKKILQEY